MRILSVGDSSLTGPESLETLARLLAGQSDARAFANPAVDAPGTWPANLDPTQYDQWPSNRHNRQTDLLFCDGHAENARRHDVIDSRNQYWRSRWNNDNSPHLEIGYWTVDPVQEARIDP